MYWYARDPRKTWPLSRRVAVDQLVLHFGWPIPFARGVLRRWVLRRSYCNAVLRRKWRIGLDGIRTAESVDKNARKSATLRLQEMNRRRLKSIIEAMARQHRKTIAEFIENGHVAAADPSGCTKI